MKQFILVSYDIVDDRRRTKVMKTLKNFGAHVQYSVFECQLDAKEFTQLKRRLLKMVTRVDSVRFYFISQDDVTRIQIMGNGAVTADSIFYLH